MICRKIKMHLKTTRKIVLNVSLKIDKKCTNDVSDGNSSSKADSAMSSKVHDSFSDWEVPPKQVITDSGLDQISCADQSQCGNPDWREAPACQSHDHHQGAFPEKHSSSCQSFDDIWAEMGRPGMSRECCEQDCIAQRTPGCSRATTHLLMEEKGIEHAVSFEADWGCNSMSFLLGRTISEGTLDILVGTGKFLRDGIQFGTRWGGREMEQQPETTTCAHEWNLGQLQCPPRGSHVQMPGRSEALGATAF